MVRQSSKENLGDKYDDNFRIWYTDKALHGDSSEQENANRTVSYIGVLQQALLDLSDWVEKGTTPPQSTNYTISDGQMVLPASASIRKGIQPIANLTVDGKKSIIGNIGTEVEFFTHIELPENTGRIIKVEWDFENNDKFYQGKLNRSAIATLATAKNKHRFLKKGIYFPTVRVTSQRKGIRNIPFCRIQNLDRVRVVIK